MEDLIRRICVFNSIRVMKIVCSRATSHHVCVRVLNAFSQKPSSRLMPRFMQSYLSTISPDHFWLLFLSSTIFFAFVNVGPYEEKPNDISKRHCIFLWMVSAKALQRIVKFEKLNFWQFLIYFIVHLTWQSMGL